VLQNHYEALDAVSATRYQIYTLTEVTERWHEPIRVQGAIMDMLTVVMEVEDAQRTTHTSTGF
jgi:hypothetical protein